MYYDFLSVQASVNVELYASLMQKFRDLFGIIINKSLCFSFFIYLCMHLN